MLDQEKQNQAAGNAQGQTGEIKERAAFLAKEVPDGCLKVVLEHVLIIEWAGYTQFGAILEKRFRTQKKATSGTEVFYNVRSRSVSDGELFHYLCCFRVEFVLYSDAPALDHCAVISRRPGLSRVYRL
jgi:hypothetical protein